MKIALRALLEKVVCGPRPLWLNCKVALTTLLLSSVSCINNCYRLVDRGWAVAPRGLWGFGAVLSERGYL